MNAANSLSPLRRHSGEFLYRYKPPNLAHLKSIIVEHQLYFSSPQQYGHLDSNDARPKFVVRDTEFMAQFIMSAYRDAYAHLPPDRLAKEIAIGDRWIRSLSSEALAAECLRVFLTDTLQSYRICSLSMRPDNDFLWREFAANATGVCFEFENREQVVPNSLVRVVEYGPTPEMDISSDEEIAGGFVFHKVASFKDEEEVRAFLFPRGRPHGQAFDPSILRRVILGRNISAYHRRIIERWCSRRLPRLPVAEQDVSSSAEGAGQI